jgi:hypothetical protein
MLTSQKRYKMKNKVKILLRIEEDRDEKTPWF